MYEGIQFSRKGDQTCDQDASVSAYPCLLELPQGLLLGPAVAVIVRELHEVGAEVDRHAAHDIDHNTHEPSWYTAASSHGSGESQASRP